LGIDYFPLYRRRVHSAGIQSQIIYDLRKPWGGLGVPPGCAFETFAAYNNVTVGGKTLPLTKCGTGDSLDKGHVHIGEREVVGGWM
jgi:hypothetical protein